MKCQRICWAWWTTPRDRTWAWSNDAGFLERLFDATRKDWRQRNPAENEARLDLIWWDRVIFWLWELSWKWSAVSLCAKLITMVVFWAPGYGMARYFHISICPTTECGPSRLGINIFVQPARFLAFHWWDTACGSSQIVWSYRFQRSAIFGRLSWKSKWVDDLKSRLVGKSQLPSIKNVWDPMQARAVLACYSLFDCLFLLEPVSCRGQRLAHSNGKRNLTVELSFTKEYNHLCSGGWIPHTDNSVLPLCAPHGARIHRPKCILPTEYCQKMLITSWKIVMEAHANQPIERFAWHRSCAYICTSGPFFLLFYFQTHLHWFCGALKLNPTK